MYFGSTQKYGNQKELGSVTFDQFSFWNVLTADIYNVAAIQGLQTYLQEQILVIDEACSRFADLWNHNDQIVIYGSKMP